MNQGKTIKPYPYHIIKGYFTPCKSCNFSKEPGVVYEEAHLQQSFVWFEIMGPSGWGMGSRKIIYYFNDMHLHYMYFCIDILCHTMVAKKKRKKEKALWEDFVCS